jgi:hypothetical protein
VLAAGWGSDLEDPAKEMALAAQAAVRQLAALAKADPDDDGDDDSSSKGDTDHDAGHTSHPLFKKLKGRGVPDAQAAKMCAKADKRAEMTALADAAGVVLSALFDDGLVALAAPRGESAEDRRSLAKRGRALPDGSYPIPDKAHLRKAAILAASKHGDYQAARRLIRKVAREEGVDVTTLPGFGSEKDDEKVAATVALAASQMKGTAAVAHPPYHGVHSHPHVHSGDNMHGPGPDRMHPHGY